MVCFPVGAAASAPFATSLSSQTSHAFYGAGLGAGIVGSGVLFFLANAQLEPCRVALDLGGEPIVG